MATMNNCEHAARQRQAVSETGYERDADREAERGRQAAEMVPVFVVCVAIITFLTLVFHQFAVATYSSAPHRVSQ